MVLPLIIFGISLLLTVWIYRSMMNSMRNRIRALVSEEREAEERYLHLSRRKKTLQRELKDLKNRAVLARKDISLAEHQAEDREPIKDTPQDRNDPDLQRAAEYMINKGLITIDQSERAINKMEAMNMDYLGVCITLGYVEMEAAKGVVKAIGLHHSTLSAD
ncbi:hypothetical protein [Desulfovibrio oxyclinae]|jgi:chromosome segregation ATPase|uniref:hypothetical protein n=1 Tax=Desulfovibrio oxyclinae TaxID=63560 RepID=UPI00035EA72C|nr:hypothetical protein [Desulfovibrio oxyclinae]